MTPNQNRRWRPRHAAERAKARRAPSYSAAGYNSGLRASQAGGAGARRLRA